MKKGTSVISGKGVLIYPEKSNIKPKTNKNKIHSQINKEEYKRTMYTNSEISQ